MRHLNIHGSLILFMSLLTSGCALMGPANTPVQHVYTLKAPTYHNHNTASRKITLLVNTPTASSGYQSKNMIYNQKDYELNSFSRNHWAGPPAEMLKPILLQSLRDSGYFHAVIGTPISAHRHLRLRVNLIELRQDFTLCPSQIKMALQASLIADQSDRVINSRVFATQVTCQQDTPYAGVIAANRATGKLMQQLAQFCVDNAVNARKKQHASAVNPAISLPEPTV